MSPTDVEQIRQRMADIRVEMHEEVEGIVEGARELTDWRHYVKSYPMGSVAVAAAIGFFAVPSKSTVINPDAESMAKLARQNRVVVESKPSAAAPKNGLASTLLTVLGGAVMRAGVAYASQQAGKLFAPSVPQPHPQETTP